MDFQGDYEKLLHRHYKSPLFNIIPRQFSPENITIYSCTILLNIIFSLMNHTYKLYPSASPSYLLYALSPHTRYMLAPSNSLLSYLSKLSRMQNAQIMRPLILQFSPFLYMGMEVGLLSVTFAKAVTLLCS